MREEQATGPTDYTTPGTITASRRWNGPSLTLRLCKQEASHLSSPSVAPGAAGSAGSRGGWRERRPSVTGPAPCWGLKPQSACRSGKPCPECPKTRFPKPGLNPERREAKKTSGFRLRGAESDKGEGCGGTRSTSSGQSLDVGQQLRELIQAEDWGLQLGKTGHWRGALPPGS